MSWKVNPEMRILFYLALFSSLLGCAENTSKGGLARYNQSKDIYYFYGDIDSNSYQSIIEVLNQNPNKEVKFVVDSNGGRINGLERAMDAIRSHGKVHWVVPENNGCYSACALLGISASKIDGTLYFHSPSSAYKNADYMLAGRNEVIIKRIVSYGYDQYMVERLLYSVNIYTKLKFKDGVIQKTR